MKYIVLLRGINISEKNKISMKEKTVKVNKTSKNSISN